MRYDGERKCKKLSVQSCLRTLDINSRENMAKRLVPKNNVSHAKKKNPKNKQKTTISQ